MRLRTCYIDRVTRSIADLSINEQARTAILHRINVPAKYRGKKHGSAMLKRVLRDADFDRVTISLELLPSGPLSYQDLVDWYKRYGFEELLLSSGCSSGYMRRKSRSYPTHAISLESAHGVRVLYTQSAFELVDGKFLCVNGFGVFLDLLGNRHAMEMPVVTLLEGERVSIRELKDEEHEQVADSASNGTRASA